MLLNFITDANDLRRNKMQYIYKYLTDVVINTNCDCLLAMKQRIGKIIFFILKGRLLNNIFASSCHEIRKKISYPLNRSPRLIWKPIFCLVGIPHKLRFYIIFIQTTARQFSENACSYIIQ